MNMHAMTETALPSGSSAQLSPKPTGQELVESHRTVRVCTCTRVQLEEAIRKSSSKFTRTLSFFAKCPFEFAVYHGQNEEKPVK